LHDLGASSRPILLSCKLQKIYHKAPIIKYHITEMTKMVCGKNYHRQKHL